MKYFLILSFFILAAPKFAFGSDCDKGKKSDQVIQIDGEDRYFFIHVPNQWDCNKGGDFLVDLHGFAGGTEHPEEHYTLDGAVKFSNDNNVLLIRPRSKYLLRNGMKLFYWDGQGKPWILENIQFIKKLIQSLRSQYGTGNNYLFGFSNGSNMSSQLLASEDLSISGVGLVGGGLFSPLDSFNPNNVNTKIYIADGTKDMLNQFKYPLINTLKGYQYEFDNFFDRKTKSGHRLSTWHYYDFWKWIKGGSFHTDEIPSNWSQEGLKDSGMITRIYPFQKKLLVTTDKGQLWQKEKDEQWKQIYQDPSQLPLLDVCVQDNDLLVAVGANYAISSNLDSSEFIKAQLPVKSLTWAVSVNCSSDGFFIAAYPTGFHGKSILQLIPSSLSDNMAETDFLGSSMDPTSGKILSVGGYGTVNYSMDWGSTFKMAQIPQWVENWIYSLSFQNGIFWGVGESGRIAKVSLNAMSIEDINTEAQDLYDISVSPSGKYLVAGGLFGTLVVSSDFGKTWTHMDNHFDFSISAVTIDDQGLILLGNEMGQIMSFRF